ncbi:glycosyltransferase family 39 protein [Amycolatopsis aidingensis]|uniref:glycosyltransferase family 39 protein n=1 Tax=Amycolatopsis aidingensis TaxID=2842453 RepID=UPI001C0E1618|nr:glycosyltransferase family 39 protein [Amycolatopsis aidingensis]
MTATALAPTARPQATAGGTARPRWQRPALLVLLAGTAVLYLWKLGASGWANDYYAMAVQGGTKDWTAWFFGSLDPGNVITVDKPPAALWLMGLSGRLFGFSSWSMLVPQALCGVAAVGLTYAAVRRWSGPVAGLLAGAALALTPAAALMFRFNNPDALLTLLLVAGAYCVLRATERASLRWLLLAGTAIGFAFLTKMLQGFLVLPAFALVYLVAAPSTLGRRLAQLLGAAGAVVVAAGWWIAAVALWPAASRPYIGGSETDSALELALGYNGLGRILGTNGNMAGGGPGGMSTAFGGEPGFGRLFGDSMGVEVSWLLPAALLALGAGLWFTRRAPRTDRTRAALLLWGGWLLVTGGVFSFMSGTLHPYYTVALAPAVGALAAIGGRELWRGRHNFAALLLLTLMVAVSGLWGYLLLARYDLGPVAVRVLVLVLTGLAVAGLLLGVDRLRRLGTALVAVCALAALLGPATVAVADVSVPHHGSIPQSGGSADGTPGGSTAADTALLDLLAATGTRWAAATDGARQGASLALGSGTAVIAIGGFTGADPAPTLAEFQRYVADGQVRYYIGEGTGGFTRGSGEIGEWVRNNYTAVTVGGSTVYDLTLPAG